MTRVEEYVWLCLQFELDPEDPAPSQDEADKAFLRSQELWEEMTPEERREDLALINPAACE